MDLMTIIRDDLSSVCFTIQQCIKFEIFTFTHYEDMKGDEKCRNWRGFGVRGHSRSLAT